MTIRSYGDYRRYGLSHSDEMRTEVHIDVDRYGMLFRRLATDRDGIFFSWRQARELTELIESEAPIHPDEPPAEAT